MRWHRGVIIRHPGHIDMTPGERAKHRCPGAHRRNGRRQELTQARSLLALTIGAVVNHGSYFTEDIDRREGPVPSPTSPGCASPS
jgi:hypothetical protein